MANSNFRHLWKFVCVSKISQKCAPFYRFTYRQNYSCDSGLLNHCLKIVFRTVTNPFETHLMVGWLVECFIVDKKLLKYFINFPTSKLFTKSWIFFSYSQKEKYNSIFLLAYTFDVYMRAYSPVEIYLPETRKKCLMS